MEVIIQSLSSILVACISASAAVHIAKGNARDKTTPHAESKESENNENCSPPEDKKSSIRARKNTRLRHLIVSLVLLIQGQLSIVAPQFVLGIEAPLSNWSCAIIGQGLLMMWLGFWTLLKE